MGYSREVYDAVRARLERRRMHAAAQAAALQEQMTARYPRLQEIRREMAATAGQVTRAVISGGDVEAAVEEIKRKNLALQAEMAEILAKAGVKSPDLSRSTSVRSAGTPAMRAGKCAAAWRRCSRRRPAAG